MIVLYNPQSSPLKKAVLPMSVMAVGAVLEGIEDYAIVDGNLVDDGLAALSDVIVSRGADIVGMTVMPGPQLADALPTCRGLRERFPDLKIIWGGYFPTLHPEAVLRSGIVDYVVRGHSELSFIPLVRAMRAGIAPRGLPGVSWLDRDNGTIVANPTGKLPDLNAMPDFPYERVEVARYLRPTFMGSRTISHHASYGCPFRCNFCAVVNMVDGRYSAQTPERMEKVVRRLVSEYGANAVEFHDNNFFVGESRVADFCRRIIPLEIGWWGYGRIDTLMKFSDRSFGLMRSSGLRMVFMGAETGSDATLARMNKGGRQTTAQALEVAARMRDFDIVPEMSFLLGNPPDPERDIADTIQFIRRVKRVNPDTEIVLYFYSPVPLAGDMYNTALNSGFSFPADLDQWAKADWVDFAQHRSAVLPWLTPSIRRSLKDFQRVLHATYPTRTDPGLRGLRRGTLRALGSWRYALEFYRWPLELQLFQRLFPYQRPEVTGF